MSDHNHKYNCLNFSFLLEKNLFFFSTCEWQSLGWNKVRVQLQRPVILCFAIRDAHASRRNGDPIVSPP